MEGDSVTDLLNYLSLYYKHLLCKLFTWLSINWSLYFCVSLVVNDI